MKKKPWFSWFFKEIPKFCFNFNLLFFTSTSFGIYLIRTHNIRYDTLPLMISSWTVLVSTSLAVSATAPTRTSLGGENFFGKNSFGIDLIDFRFCLDTNVIFRKWIVIVALILAIDITLIFVKTYFLFQVFFLENTNACRISCWRWAFKSRFGYCYCYGRSSSCWSCYYSNGFSTECTVNQ